MTSRMELDAAVQRLIEQFGQDLAVGSIIRCFARSVRDLRAAGVRAPGLAHAAESMAAVRLRRRLAMSTVPVPA